MKKTTLLLLMLFAFSATHTFAQRTISGRVTDETGAGVFAASISVERSSMGTLSGADGMYSITLPSDRTEFVLIFNYLGYEKQKVKVGAANVINVQLKETSVGLEDIVVTGFKDVKKEMFTGSSVKVDMEDLKLSGGVDVSRMLEGKAAGVSIQNVSSTFGSAPKVRIRGATSINGENKPLWVVDGVVLEDIVNVSNDQLSSGDPTTLLGSSVAGLSASDIASMDILKDAQATALYGARAMNGVIVITTKRGQSGAPRVTYTSNLTVRSKPSYASFDIMNSADQMAVNAELERKGWLPVDMVNWASSGPYGKMYQALFVADENTGFQVINSPEGRKNFLLPYAKANTDWFDLLFTNNLMQEHSLSISTGTDKSKTYASLSFLHDAGVTIADKVSRYTFNIRNDYEVTSKLSTALQLLGSYRDQQVPGSFNRGSDPVRGSWSRDFDTNPFSYAYNTSRAVRPYDENGDLEFVQMNFAPFNILHELQNNWMEQNMIDIKAQAELKYELVKGLKYGFTGCLRYVQAGLDHTITETANASEAYRAAINAIVRKNNPFLWKDVEDPAEQKISVLNEGGFLRQRGNKMQNYYVRNTLSYNTVWGGERTHEFSFFGGMDVKYVDKYLTTSSIAGYLYYNGRRFVENSDYARKLREENTSRFASTYAYERFVAFFGNADYAFDRRYSLSASVRYDGSNALGKDASARWLPTGTFAGKWNIINESFMEPLSPIFSAMSFRASFGLNATMPPATNSSAIFYDDLTFAPGGYRQNTITYSSLGNAYLTWEKAYMLNVGFDFAMFQNRLDFSFEHWTRWSFDLIAEIKDSGIGGQIEKLSNYADLYSKGIDLVLGGSPVKTEDWEWKANVTFGYSFNEIRNAKNLPQIMDLVSQTGGNKNGYPVNSLFSIPFVGLDPSNGTPLFEQPDGSEPRSDAYLQSVNTDYLKYEGPVDPPYTGGLNNTLTWKGISLNLFFSYQWGSMVRLHPSFSEQYSDLSALSRDFKNRWVMSGDEKTTTVPSIIGRLDAMENSLSYPYNNYNFSSVRVARGDFIRLKSLSLSYDVPTEWLEALKSVRTASLRVTGKDLWLIYSDSRLNGQDPEFLNTGGVALPALPQVIVSVTLGF
ncbi:MAG: SusC/RagA family TonB-linked outer membrane protein [Prevotellaceae bacterium]|jgi:TonB-linked SusC/RagA family outer membrane protein|nr:SusC/RagA family TonB-linked outer membrane protein [Prevotellaceae bacterium]